MTDLCEPEKVTLAEQNLYCAVDLSNDFPIFTGHLVKDVISLTGLSIAELAELTGVEESEVDTWNCRPIPPNAKTVLTYLKEVGLVLIGGLGRDGVNKWLHSHNRLGNIKVGRSHNMDALMFCMYRYKNSISS